jgi:hypothetical protein
MLLQVGATVELDSGTRFKCITRSIVIISHLEIGRPYGDKQIKLKLAKTIGGTVWH